MGIAGPNPPSKDPAAPPASRAARPAPSGIVLSDAQWAAVKAVVEWYRTRPRPFFYLAGFAGTGKSTILPFILAELGLHTVRYAAYTGKAASVMRAKGCPDASTIHRLAYKSSEYWADGQLRFRFTLNEDSDIAGAQLLVLDECSMVGTKIAEDLLSFKTPILVLGDPGQLPPIEGEGFFTGGVPDTMLTEVHRQALDNPILAASMAVRQDPRCDLRRHADGERLKVLDLKSTTPDLFLAADQVIVGRHKTRRALNRRLRTHAGHRDPLPLSPGAKIVCVRNKHDLGLMNGVVYATTAAATRPDAARLQEEWNLGARGLLAGKFKALRELARKDAHLFTRWIDARFADDDGREFAAGLHVAPFEEEERGEPAPEFRQRLDHDMSGPLGLVQATWGYALTVHKSQGSQWDDVVMTFDPIGGGTENLGRWLYTGITRAASSLTLVV